MIEKGKVVSLPEGKWIKKKPQEFTEGPNLVVKKVDCDTVLCDVIFWPRNRKKDLEL